MAPDKVCPNCGAAIEGDVCPSCASATISSEHETLVGDPRLAPIASASFAEPDDEPEEPSGVLGLDLGAEPSRAAATAATAPRAVAAPPRSETTSSDELEHDHVHDHGGIVTRSAWPIVLLAGYATAATLACGYLWWNGRRGPSGPPGGWAAGLAAAEAEAGAPEPDPEDAEGRRGARSAVVEPSESIPADRLVELGASTTIDDLEIAPLDVEAGPVRLVRSRIDGSQSSRPGGDGALALRLRLRNESATAIFAPLDEAYVREPDRRLPDTFIESANGERIYAYRLPVDSEWEIDGQRFVELRPGESIETRIVSDVDAVDRLDGPLTWRIKLRTAPETTAVVGVTFVTDDVEDRP